MTDTDNTERIGGGNGARSTHERGVAAEGDDLTPALDALRKDLPGWDIQVSRHAADDNPDAALIQNVLNAFEAFERGRR